MNYRLSMDRLVLYSVVLWALLPSGLLAWSGNKPGPENTQWLGQFCRGYMDALCNVGILGAVFGFLYAGVTWLVHKQKWNRMVKIVVLFLLPVLALMMMGGWEFALFYLPVSLIGPLTYLLCARKVKN